MPRKKNYEDKDVIEKATNLFWQNGYQNTSMSLLESTMGINKFSIYASFGSKQGVFLASLKVYRDQHTPAIIKLKQSSQGLPAIKQFFYDCLDIYHDKESSKGCLMSNTRAQINNKEDAAILSEIHAFVEYQRQLFIEKLIQDGLEQTVATKKANYLIIAKQAVSAASKVHPIEQVNDFIELTFSAI